MKTLPATATLAFALLALAACGGTPTPEPATSTPEPSTTATASTPALRRVAVGQPFDLPGWRVTVTGQKCGPATDVVPDAAGMDWHDPMCVVATTAVNTGNVPAGFAYGYDTDTPAYGLDGQGRRYNLAPYSRGDLNPGVPVAEPMLFAVPAGVRLAMVVVGGVAVTLS